MIYVIGSQMENILFLDTLNIESASDVDGVRGHAELPSCCCSELRLGME